MLLHEHNLTPLLPQPVGAPGVGVSYPESEPSLVIAFSLGSRSSGEGAHFRCGHRVVREKLDCSVIQDDSSCSN